MVIGHWSILTDLSDVFARTKLHKKNLEIFLYAILREKKRLISFFISNKYTNLETVDSQLKYTMNWLKSNPYQKKCSF